MMPKRDRAPIGAPCWIDLLTLDIDRSREFYCELFGWEAEEPAEEYGGYFNFRKDGVRVAGCMGREPGSDLSDMWSVYLATEDAAVTSKLAGEHGGQSFIEPMEVGDLGTMGMIGDAGGAGVGIWQPGGHQGFGVWNEASAPVWFELHTREYAAALDFYRNVFGWQTQVESDTSEFRYTTMVDDGVQLAGVMDASGMLPDGVPPHWRVYFGTDDVDATLARVAALGGAVVQAAEDTPYGRLAVATDPTGAQFSLNAGPA